MCQNFLQFSKDKTERIISGAKESGVRCNSGLRPNFQKPHAWVLTKTPQFSEPHIPIPSYSYAKKNWF